MNSITTIITKSRVIIAFALYLMISVMSLVVLPYKMTNTSFKCLEI
jgi:hypothetical protein